MLGLIQVFPRRTAVAKHRDMGFGAKQAEHLVSRLASLSSCLSPYAEGWEREMSLSSSFVPRQAMPPLAGVLQV